MRTSRGARFAGETLEHVPGNEKIRPLRDQIIVAPLEVVYSRYIYVGQNHKPLRGKVLAVGPGCYPKVYDHPEKHKRTKMWESKAFRPTEVRAGDTVELGGSEIEGYAFEQFWWGDELCLICREADVCFVS
jgi:co-chaperonin GroES (HSP10)